MSKLINYLLKTINSEIKLCDALEVLKEQKIDYFSIKEPNISALNHLVFYYFLKQPDEKQKELLTKIWNFDNGVYRSNLSHHCGSSLFGRELLKNKSDKQETLTTIINNGSISEMKSFISENPDIFKGIDQSLYYSTRIFTEISPKLSYTPRFYNLPKAVLAEQSGLIIDEHILKDILVNHPVKNPSKTLKLLKDKKSSMDEEAWDKIIIILINQCNSTHHFSRSKEKKIFDTWALLSEINHLEKLKPHNLIMVPNKDYNSCTFFYECHKDISKEQFYTFCIPYIMKMDLNKFILNPCYEEIKPLLSNAQKEKIILSSLEDMLSLDKMYARHLNPQKIQLYTNETYNKQLFDSFFVNTLLTATLFKPDTSDFLKILSCTNGKQLYTGHTDIVKFFNSVSEDKILKKQIFNHCAKNDFGGDFQNLLSNIRLKHTLKVNKITQKIKL